MLVSRRGSLTLLGASLLLAACGGGSDRPLLRVGSQRGGTKSLLLSSGALAGAPYEVEWSEFPAAQTMLEAIAGGAVDVGMVGDAPFQFAYQSGSPIRIIGAQRRDPAPSESLAIIVPHNATARTLADLRGKRISTTRGSVGHYLVLRALAAAGLLADAVQFTFLSPGDAKAAFSSGSIDAWAIWTPYLAAALAEGARILVDGKDVVRGYGFDVTSVEAIAKKRTMLADFLHREAMALEWAAAHLDDYSRVLAQETGLPPAIARITAEKHVSGRVPIDDQLVADQAEVLKTFRAAGGIVGDKPIEQAFVRNLA